MKKTITVDEHKRSVRKLYKKRQEIVAHAVNMCQHKVIPRTGFALFLHDMSLVIDKWVHGKK